MKGTESGLSFRTKSLYGFGTVAFGVKDQGFAALLMLYYNQVLGLPAAWVGAAIMIAMIVDAIFDPLLGQISDEVRSPWGRRHPFMYAAAVPIAISYFFLWAPPSLENNLQFAYLVVIAIVVRLSISVYEIPSTALLAEFTRDYDERTSLVAYRYFFGVVGGMTMTIVTFKYFLTSTPGQPNGALNAEGYLTYAWVAALIMLISVVVSTLGTHNRIPSLRVTGPAERVGVKKMLRAMKEILLDPTYASILLASLFFAVAAGLNTSLGIYFSTYVWELTSDEIALVSSGAFGGIVLAFMVAVPLSKRYGKKYTAIALFAISMVAGISPLALRAMEVFPANDSPLLVPLLMGQIAFTTMCTIAGSILAVSMVADVGEYVELRTGKRAEGLLFSAVIMVNKAISGMGVFAAGLLLALVGFPDDAKPGAVAGIVIHNLTLTYIFAVVLVTCMAILCLWFYPITREHHADAIQKLKEST